MFTITIWNPLMILMFLMFTYIVTRRKLSGDIKNYMPIQDFSETHFSEFVKYEVSRFNIMLKAFSLKIGNDLDMKNMKDKLLEIIALTTEFQNLTKNCPSKLFTIINLLESLINLKQEQEANNLYYNKNTSNNKWTEFIGSKFREDIIELVNFFEMLLSFDKEQTKHITNQYKSLRLARKIIIEIFSSLIRVLLSSIYENVHEEAKISIFMQIDIHMFQQEISRFSKLEEATFLYNLTEKEIDLCKNIRNATILVFTKSIFDSFAKKIKECEKMNDNLYNTMTKIEALFIIILYIMNESIIQLRKRQIDLYGVDLKLQDVLSRKNHKFNKNITLENDIILTHLSFNRLKKHDVLTLREKIIRVFDHTCENCSGYKVEGFVEKCLKKSLHILLESMLISLQQEPKINLFLDYENVLEVKVYIKNVIYNSVNSKYFEHNNLNIEDKCLKTNIDTLKDDIYNEFIIYLHDSSVAKEVTKIENQISKLKHQIMKVQEYKDKYNIFINEFKSKARNQIKRENTIFKYFHILLTERVTEKKERFPMKFTKDPYIPIMSVYISILGYFYKDFVVNEQYKRLMALITENMC